jgi:hypothetical protein
MLTYQFIFFPHVGYGWVDNCRQAAINAGYSMFLWNDRIYDSYTGEDTGKTVKDVS